MMVIEGTTEFAVHMYSMSKLRVHCRGSNSNLAKDSCRKMLVYTYGGTGYEKVPTFSLTLEQ